MSKKQIKYSKATNDNLNVVNEPVMAYSSFVSTSFWKLIVSGISVPINKLTSLEKMELLEKGIKKSDLENFKLKAHLDYDKLSQALSVTRATLINNKSDFYSEGISERILALTDLYSYGYEVFEDEEKFNSWLFTSNKSLGNKKPFDIIDNQFGREEIKNIIGRIEHGIYS